MAVDDLYNRVRRRMISAFPPMGICVLRLTAVSACDGVSEPNPVRGQAPQRGARLRAGTRADACRRGSTARLHKQQSLSVGDHDIQPCDLPAARAQCRDLGEEGADRFPQSVSTMSIRKRYLWVLGVYEIVRSIDQRCRTTPELVDDAAARIVRSAKHGFERLRVPLAKFEAARRFRDTDSTIAFPALQPEHGIAWRISENVFIASRELSDCFMYTLRAL